MSYFKLGPSIFPPPHVITGLPPLTDHLHNSSDRRSPPAPALLPLRRPNASHRCPSFVCVSTCCSGKVERLTCSTETAHVYSHNCGSAPNTNHVFSGDGPNNERWGLGGVAGGDWRGFLFVFSFRSGVAGRSLCWCVLWNIRRCGRDLIRVRIMLEEKACGM